MFAGTIMLFFSFKIETYNAPADVRLLQVCQCTYWMKKSTGPNTGNDDEKAVLPFYLH
jgi:hypothetical protein